MKKYVCLLLIILFVAGTLPVASFPASAKGLVMPSDFGGIQNVMLMYTFGNQGAVSSRHTVETLLPYAGYYGTDGKLKDTFYDAFLLLPCVSTGPSGGTMYLSKNPAVSSDWQAYIDDIFANGYNLDALNTAVGEVKKGLGKKDYKVKVFFTLIYPTEGQTNFGSIGGKTYDFSKTEDRIAICKWQVDNYIKLFNSGNYENLELFGFYWFEEFINTSSRTEKTLLTSATDYIRSKGYKSVWIPYYMAQGWNKWKEYGFDIACLQPNYMFNANAEKERVKNAVDYAKQYDMCNEVEISGKICDSTDYYNRYLTYLKDFAANGAMNAVKMYYQDVRFYYECYRSKIPEIRLLYDLTYKYAKGTLKESDVADKYVDSINELDGLDIISYGCSYTATTPYTNSTNGYADISGNELTDGAYYTSSYGTEWHAFYRNYTEKDGKHQVILDLGSVYTDLKKIYMEFREDPGASIGLPEYVEFYISDNGKDYTLLKKVSLSKAAIGCPGAVINQKFSARYIKAIFPTSSKSFVFVSELAVGQERRSHVWGEGYDIISTGCKYDAFTPYTNTAEWDAPYMKIDGKELTDGILATSSLGTEWHDMHGSMLEDGEKFFITVDLGKIRDDLSYFDMQFGYDLSSGISKPNTVTYSVSEDGVNFTKIGTVAVVLSKDGYAYATMKAAENIKARYVKAEFLPDNSLHNFVSEMVVGVSEQTEEEEKPGEYITGDVNLSGKYEIADYISALRIIAGILNATETEFSAADVNGDGVISDTDVEAIKAFILN
ncbi:MAG: DUF4855 domain-containing protein [Clostridia bacterium]|nr:DUF4855 domain-containing protein [Clostridia bacterium]